jgi:hypothetical protein
VEAVAPSVVSISVNADQVDPPRLPVGEQPTSWQTQRSLIRSLLIEFSTAVTITTGDIALTNLGVNAPLDEDSTVVLNQDQLRVDGNRVWVDFAEQPLADGIYQIELAASIVDGAGTPLDGDGDGVGGDAYRLSGTLQNGLYQLGGEWNGDGGVTIFDFPTVAYWFGQPSGRAPIYVDLNQDTGVTIFDFALFAGNFGRQMVFDPSPLLVQVKPPDNPSSPTEDHSLERPTQRQPLVPQPQPPRRGRMHQSIRPNVSAEQEWESLLNLLAGELASLDRRS